MRSSLLVVAFLSTAIASLAGCSSDEDASSSAPLFASNGASGSTSTTGGTSPSGLGAVAAGAPAPALGPVDPATTSHPEVVQIAMPGITDGMMWFCTGALVSSTVVVTAAHCMQTSLFSSWTVIAPTLKARPRVDARPAMYDAAWDDVAHPDLGVLHLETPIELAQYAELTDATARVDGGQTVEVSTIVRTKELPEAPFMRAGTMRVSSTAEIGYAHGYGVPFFSHGGDSGAGMFLLENGQMTHKLIGVEREPDQDRGLDHLSRVDAAFIAWVAAGGAGAAQPGPIAGGTPAPGPAPEPTQPGNGKKK